MNYGIHSSQSGARDPKGYGLFSYSLWWVLGRVSVMEITLFVGAVSVIVFQIPPQVQELILRGFEDRSGNILFISIFYLHCRRKCRII